jgi:hypothetical protein
MRSSRYCKGICGFCLVKLHYLNFLSIGVVLIRIVYVHDYGFMFVLFNLLAY